MIDGTYQNGIHPEEAGEPLFMLEDDEAEQRRAMPLAAAALGALMILLVLVLVNWVC